MAPTIHSFQVSATLFVILAQMLAIGVTTRIDIPCNTRKVLHGAILFFPLTFSKLFHFLFFEFF